MENNDKPSYYAIIPANVRYDNELRANEKLMYGEITCLTHKNGYCYASNKYFSELYGVTPQAISKWVTNLKNKNYINVYYETDGKEIKQRIITMVSTNIDRVLTNDEEGINKCLQGYKQKFKDNNTSINNTSINNTSINNTSISPAKAEPLPYKDIIDYLNFKIESNYRHTTTKTKDLIKARFNDGFTAEDFKVVIDKKSKEWLKDKKMSKFLRPETLFGTKFENYLNQKEERPTLNDLDIDISDMLDM